MSVENESDNFFLQQPEPIKGCLLALREIILKYDRNITPAWKYRMPFFCYHGKMCCYLWVHKKHKVPYLGIVAGDKVHHRDLIQEKRARMKIIMFDPNRDLPMKSIHSILKQVVAVYRVLD